MVRDFNYTTARQAVKPYVLFQKPIFYLCFLVRVDPLHKAETIEGLKKLWEEEYPDYPFSYSFINDLYGKAYEKEIYQAKLSAFFSILALVIICMGLFSVTSVLVARRTREIGIRKVNGATISEVMLLLNYKFILWVAIAFCLACPVALYAMNRWLQSFVSKTELNRGVFAAAGAIVLFMTLFTVTLKSWRAAGKNPAEALRHE